MVDVAVSYQTVLPGEVGLDSFAGADDSTKLAAAMSYAGQQSHPPPIRFGAKPRAFTKPLGKPYPNTVLVGGNPGWSTYGKASCQAFVDCGKSVPWIDTSDSPEFLTMRDILFWNRDYQTQFIGNPSNPNGTLRHADLHNIQCLGFAGVLGNKARKLLLLECNFTGPWSIGAYKENPIHIGGSDCMALWPQGMDLNTTSAGPSEEYAFIADSLQKSNIGPIYWTAQAGWRALYAYGNGCGLTVNGAVIEGAGDGSPCDGALIRVAGGGVTFNDCNIGMGMKAPAKTAAANGSGIADRALVEVTGAASGAEYVQAGFNGCNWYHASGVSHDTPVVYASGQCRVTERGSQSYHSYSDGNTWDSTLPMFKADAGQIVDHGNTVRVA